MRNIIILVVVVAVLAGGFFLYQSFTEDESEPTVTTTQTGTNTDSATPSASANGNTEDAEEGGTSAVTITYTDSEFSPAEVTLKSGGTITWVNNGSSNIEIGANPHPVHTGNREVSGGEFVLTLGSGQESTVTLSEVGSFGYHNHLNASQGGTINVVE